MCARFVMAISPEKIEEMLGVFVPEDVEPRYNIAPSQDILAITAHGHVREARRFRWGLIPSWAEDPSIGRRLINARAETASQKPAFRSAFRSRRCVIPATGFIEWSHSSEERRAAADLAREGQMSLDLDLPSPRKAPPKQPFLISLRDEPVFAMAGLWERWNSPAGPVDTCAILTTRPNELIAELHNRMPCILDREGIDDWLSEESSSKLIALLSPYPAEKMTSVKIDPRINDPSMDGAEVLRAA